MILQRLPCYISTIIFRAMSLALTISFLREFSVIPIAILLVEGVVVVTLRFIKTSKPSDQKIGDILTLSVINIGSMSAYGRRTNYKDDQGNDIPEDDEAVSKFIKTSCSLTTAHHFAVLATIIVMGTLSPTYFEHWNSPDFLLRPTTDNFYWTFSVTMLLGVHSVTLLLYRARNIVQVENSAKVDV